MDERTEQEKRKIRSNNLKRVIDTLERGYEQASELTKRTVGTLKKDTQPSHGIARKLAIKLEKDLSLPTGYLDIEDHERKNIYYVMLTVEDSETYDIVNWLFENAKEVLECSAILGEFDIFVKVEAPNFYYLEEFFAKLTRLPKAVRTQTFAAVDSIRWQRDQIGYNEVKDPHPIKRLPDTYVKTRINSYIHEIKELERGKIVAYEHSDHKLRLLDIINDAQKSFFSIREYKEEIYEYEKYLSKEKDKIEQNVNSKRIFIIPDELLTDDERNGELEELLSEAKRIIDINGRVRILPEGDWIKRGHNRKPECFVIVDNLYVCVKKIREEKTVLHKDKDRISRYLQTFDSNWEKAIPFENLYKV